MSSDFTKNLLDWNKTENRRQMPWKGDRDPYRIWLSEIILQQTRVEQGLAYYARFLDVFPTIQALATANDGLVFKMWEGLGYYTRCKNLIATARVIYYELGGKFPSSYDSLLELKGIGPYTASAIASFAFDEPKAVLDGNVQRVLARYFGLSTRVGSREGKLLFQEIAQDLIDKDNPASYNQAIMDFGATICKPKNPLCESCVQRSECESVKHGFVDLLPVKRKKMKMRSRWLYYFIISSGDGVYIRKREEKDIWENLHEFVLLEREQPLIEVAGEFLNNLLKENTYQITSQSTIYKQQLTHQLIQGQFIEVTVSNGSTLDKRYRLVSRTELESLAFPNLINQYLRDTF